MKAQIIRQSLLAASVITIGTSILSRLFGYVREAAVAGYFGTSASLDTFVIAFTTPELISFIAFAALPTALIPLSRRLEAEGETDEGGLFWDGCIAFAAVFAALSGLIYLLRDVILNGIAPTLEAAQMEEGRHLISILACFVFFRGMEAYFRGWLFAKKHFLVPATSSIIINLVILAAIYSFYGTMSIASLAYGWLIGSAALFFYNGFFVFRILRPRRPHDIGSSPVGTLMRITLVIVLVESIALIYPVVDRLFAARLLGEGQISALRYALFLVHIPTGILVVSFNLATFPWIADLTQGAERQKLISLYLKSVRLLFFVMALIALGIVVFANEVVFVAFKRGAFDLVSITLTAPTLAWYALGIVFYSVYLFQMRFYYAHGMLRRLAFFLLSMLLLKVGLSYFLVGPMEHNGLALATTLAWFSGCVIMTVDLGRHLHVSMSSLTVPTLPRVLVALCATLLVWLVLIRLWPHDPQAPLLFVFVRLTVMAIVGTSVYVGAGYLLKLDESARLIAYLRSRVSRERQS